MVKPIYRMSGVGYCPRALSAQRLEYPTEPAPTWLERAAQEGNMHEGWIRAGLQADGCKVWNDQFVLRNEQERFILTGHIDGMIIDPRVHPSDEYLLEIKSMSEYEFNRWMKGKFEAFSSYAAQVACYLDATGLKGIYYMVKNRSNGYIDKTVTQEAPMDVKEIYDKLNLVEDYVSKNELAQAYLDPDSIECRRCNYKSLCAPAPMDFGVVPEAKLIEATVNYRKGKILEEEAKGLIDEAKRVFLTQTEATEQKKWRFNELIITKVDVKPSVTYPKDNLLKVFTEEDLKPAESIKAGYGFIKITDENKED